MISSSDNGTKHENTDFHVHLQWKMVSFPNSFDSYIMYFIRVLFVSEFNFPSAATLLIAQQLQVIFTLTSLLPQNINRLLQKLLYRKFVSLNHWGDCVIRRFPQKSKNRDSLLLNISFSFSVTVFAFEFLLSCLSNSASSRTLCNLTWLSDVQQFYTVHLLHQCFYLSLSVLCSDLFYAQKLFHFIYLFIFIMHKSG